MSAENEEKKRRCAPWLIAYYEEALLLPENLQGPFVMELQNSLFNKGYVPDFSEKYEGLELRCLNNGWAHVEKWLQNGWTLSERRSHPGRAGAPKGNQNARKKNNQTINNKE